MPETQINFETRPLAVEDVGFDVDGLGSKSSYTDHNGTPHIITYINASHIPLLFETRSLLDNVADVDSALALLARRVAAFSQSVTVLAEDTVITLDSTALSSTLQTIIDSQPKNLGGHTLTFQFSEGVDAVLTDTLEFDGFYNGALIIDLNGDTVFDNSDIGSIFYFHDCFCLAGVNNGGITHTHSQNAVSTTRMPCFYLWDVAFTGGGSNTFALYATDTDGYVANSCTYSNVTKNYLDGIIVQDVEEKLSGKANTDLDNLTNAGRNVIVAVAHELDWDAASVIPASETFYQSLRAGVVVVRGTATSANGQIGAWTTKTANTTGGAVGNQLPFPAAVAALTMTVSICVPKGGYYYVQMYNVASGEAYFIPFKYSTAG